MYILFIFLVTENIIERFIPSISWFDEVITIILFILTIINFVKYPIQKKSYLRIYIYLIFLIIIGLAGNYIYDIQKSPIAIIKDIVALLKFFIVYIYAERYISLKKSQKIIKKILKFVRIYLIFLMIFAIINQFTNIGMDSGYRGVIKTYMFMYSHSTFMVASVIAVSSILIGDGIKKNWLYLCMATIILCFSMRAKAFIYIITVSILYIVVNGKYHFINHHSIKKTSNRLLKTGVLIAVVGLIINRDKITAYWDWGLMAARPALYIVGFKIMFDYFPLGSGFGTFGSSISGEFYSSLYYKYGIQNTSGLIKSEGYKYMADTYWPYIIAQYGLVGMILYMLGLYEILKLIIQDTKSDTDCFIASISLFIYLIISCFVESGFTNASIILIAFVLGYYMRVQSIMKGTDKI
ncbi:MULTISPECIES: hypothetical protein [Clostridium]|jgi:hypothetical protein|uniref:hypothetical protein n=1 Tax=Clostridium TaxID=1485 RepID=UPI000E4A732F|nr:hypothetical protein [[Clostridium] innocuum]MCQ5277023.1 hypothetical protein [Clostridium sp. DFI.1.208]RHV66109.1 hypothetical protein DXB22_07355 [Clostridiaceae bacterium OM02-2AC]MCC2844792.1 hypothetical protein [[Clostridium] innocuum]MCC2849111.1 hypothetical protein [[Clostridium] innocuum]MCC2853094.1 hypothetical protein [[Clostridium] innocuum]